VGHLAKSKVQEPQPDATTIPGREVTVPGVSTNPRAVASAACLVIIYGDELGKRIPLGIGSLKVGRSSKSDIQLDQDSVSRVHAEFKSNGSIVTVLDLGSTNGTYVNDRVVGGEAVLTDGDQIKIGGAIFKFLTGGNMEAHYHEEIYRLMTVDGLTQVYNKRYFVEALEREMSRTRRHKRPLALAMLDLDHFKQINDTYGHLAGDAVLRQFCAVLKANIRREDLLARHGGEEFGLILPEIDLAGARIMAEKLRALIERSSFEFEDVKIPVTASIGLSERVDSLHDPVELVREADERLYEAKRGGRNTVRG